MRLFFTDNEFVWKGVARPNIPFLCDSEMELVSAPNEYLRYVAAVRGRTRSEKTWATYGHHLYEFFAFLEANDLGWDKVDQTHIAAWRDAMLERSCERTTVNQRLRCVHAFYQWVTREGRIHAVPFATEDIWVAKPRGFLAHVDASGGRFDANELTVQTHKPLPKFLHMDKAIHFIEALSPHSLKLMAYLALLTGMRRFEIVGLDYRVVPNPAGHDPGKQLRMVLDPMLTPTKGDKERFVMLPYDLSVALWDYFSGIDYKHGLDWNKRNALFKRSHGKESTRFFLSSYGEELSERYLNNAFADASKATGIKCNPHKLRHTFGTYELLRMSKKVGQSQALLWVRNRMGHSSITTTEQYIHAADLVQHDDVDGYQLEVLEALRRGH
ncbi:MAG TPA: tyrosine-type recombinase/integrase [Noviherbaspirillum sp.]|nr:tyrosine-type recombinase/integrase [Noviherbaspirillum sp.]